MGFVTLSIDQGDVPMVSDLDNKITQETEYLMKTEANRQVLVNSIVSVRRGEGKVLMPDGNEITFRKKEQVRPEVMNYAKQYFEEHQALMDRLMDI